MRVSLDPDALKLESIARFECEEKILGEPVAVVSN